MKKMYRKFLSVLLALCILLSIMPSPTQAAVTAGSTIDIGGAAGISLDSTASGTGWSWNPSTATLTLTSEYAGAPIAINCQGNDTVTLNYTGDVTVTGSASDAISCIGNLNITGSGGTLTAAYTGGSYYSALLSENVLRIQGGNLVLESSGSNFEFYTATVMAGYGGVSVENDASVRVTATSRTGDCAGILFNYYANLSINTTGTVAVTATGMNYTIYGTFMLNGGSVTLNSGAGKYYSKLVQTGGTISFNGGQPPSGLSLSPAGGSENGGETITLTGDNLAGTTAVRVDGVPVDNVAVSSNTLVTFTMPGRATDSYNPFIVVETTGGMAALPSNSYTYTPVSGTIENFAVLKSMLESTTVGAITLTGDINLSGSVTLGGDHILNIPAGRTLTIMNEGYISLNMHTLTITGGGSLNIKNKSRAGLLDSYSSGTLNLEAVAVTLSNTDSGGISVPNMNVGQGATVVLDSPTGSKLINQSGWYYTLNVTTGSAIRVENFYGEGIYNNGEINLKGGSVTVDGAERGSYAIDNESASLFNLESGTITGSAVGGVLYFKAGARVTGMQGKLKDRGELLSNNGEVTVTVAALDTLASGAVVTAGPYLWDAASNTFAKSQITIQTQPLGKTVSYGAANETVSILASVENGRPLHYLWKYWEEGTGGYTYQTYESSNPVFVIPSDLAIGSYELCCEVSAPGCQPITSDTVILTVTASGGGNGGGGGGGNGSGSSSPAPTTKTDTSSTATVSGVTATAKVTAKAGSDGKATASVSQAQIKDAVEKAKEAAAKTGNTPRVEIRTEAAAGTGTIETVVPKASISDLVSDKIEALTISGPIASISFDARALGTISGAASGDVIFTAARSNAASLSGSARSLVGDRPVYDFSVTSGGNAISQFGGPVTVSLPYTPAAGEDLSALIVCFINDSGNLEIVTNGRYNASTGTVVFTTDHFSKYAVGYNKISFSDVKDTAWYGKAVSYIAAREITSGSGSGKFSPDAPLTRGQFMVMLMKAYGISPDKTPADNFTDAGNTYYTGYLAAAKRLGLSGGVGDNRFAPESDITRQEMFTLLYNVLKSFDKLPEGNSGKKLSDFSDSAGISSWARPAVELFVETGSISGSKGLITPDSETTRAEMVQVLYNLLSK